MKQHYSFQECYLILGTPPGASWEELRLNYKALIQKWHPDKFDNDPSKKEGANHRIKELNSAYDLLARYYKQHGYLPVFDPATEPDDSIPPPSTEEAPTPEEAETDNTTSDATIFDSQFYEEDSNIPNYKPAIIAVTFFFVLFIIVIELIRPNTTIKHVPETEQQHANHIKQSEQASQQQTTNPLLLDDKKKEKNNDDKEPDDKITKNKMHFFTYGSSIGEVIAIQGVPSNIESDIWYYEDSSVIFRDGKVIDWHREKYPLNARAIIPSTLVKKDKNKKNNKKQLSGTLTK